MGLEGWEMQLCLAVNYTQLKKKEEKKKQLWKMMP